jgi:hypothetical protein
MRLLYTGDFTTEKFTRALTSTSEYLKGVTLTPGALKLINSDIIYVFGRDHKLRPNICMAPGKINLAIHRPEDVKLAYFYVATMVRRYMFYPGKIENINLVLDATNMGLTSLPVIS